MDPHVPDHGRYRLHSYERSLTDAVRYFADAGAPGSFRAGDLYREKSLAAEYLETIHENDIYRQELFSEIDQLNRRLDTLEQKWGMDHKDKLFGELRYFLDSYHAGLCWLSTMSMDPSAVAEVAHREVIGIILEELRGDSDLADWEQVLRELDAAFAEAQDVRQTPGAGPHQVLHPVPMPGPVFAREETIREE